MTTPVKIKIECEDTLLAHAIASSISEGLRLDDFSNVQVKTLMIMSEAYVQAKPAPREDFDKKNIIHSVIDPEVLGESKPVWRPSYCETTLMSPELALAWPMANETLRQRNPELLKSPILIDMGIEPADYAKRADAFLKGES